MALRFSEAERAVYAKAEFLDPSGSIKDRLAACVVADAEGRGLLRPDSNIRKCTSGNTGISLARVGAARNSFDRVAARTLAGQHRGPGDDAPAQPGSCN